MIQFIIMLLGLAFSNNNANTVKRDGNQDTRTVQKEASKAESSVNPVDTSGDNGQLPPRK